MIAPGADAVFLPPRANFLEAIQEALESQHQLRARLYTDGNRLAWLPKPARGWFRIHARINDRTETA